MISKTKRPYDPGELCPRTKLRRNFQDMAATNALSMGRLSETCRDVNDVDQGSFADIARLQSGKNAARDLRRKFSKNVAWMPEYWAQVRCKTVKTQLTELQWIAFNLPHEVVHTIARLSTIEKLLATDNMDPLTKQHLELCEQEAQCKLLGIGLWADGTPCNWDRSETVETLSMNFPGLIGEYRNLRIPVTALSKKNVCENTWSDIHVVVKWSLEVLATGGWPTCRHDGSAWRKSDGKRTALREIQRSCLVEVRADWDWMAKVWGFPPNRFKVGCCWKCTCTPDQVMDNSFIPKNLLLRRPTKLPQKLNMNIFNSVLYNGAPQNENHYTHINSNAILLIHTAENLTKGKSLHT